MANGKSAENGICPAECYKALLYDRELHFFFAKLRMNTGNLVAFHMVTSQVAHHQTEQRRL
jgi:hypothetical protein